MGRYFSDISLHSFKVPFFSSIFFLNLLLFFFKFNSLLEMHGSKLSLIVVFMFSAVAARLIPNGDVDKEHNSDDQERLDRQDYFFDLPDEDPEPAGKTIDELIGGGNDIELPGHHRAAHGCVQWGEPCTRDTECCEKKNYEGVCVSLFSRCFPIGKEN